MTETSKKNGRPSIFSDEIANEIRNRLIEGESMRDICADAHMPCRATVSNWMEADEAFSAKCARARMWQADYMDDLVLDTAKQCTSETANADRVKIGAYQWRAERLNQGRYGNKIQQQITGLNGGAIEISAKTKLISEIMLLVAPEAKKE